jgi:hypothetical protein
MHGRQFKIALFTVAFCFSFAVTSIVGLVVKPHKAAQSDVALRLSITPPGVAI